MVPAHASSEVVAKPVDLSGLSEEHVGPSAQDESVGLELPPSPARRPLRDGPDPLPPQREALGVARGEAVAAHDGVGEAATEERGGVLVEHAGHRLARGEG